MRGAVSPQDQISELNKKLQLHEGDLKAYIEASNTEINQNNEQIASLRHENKQLHRRLADVINGDDKVIDKALGDRKIEKQALKSKPGREAVQIIDQKVCDSIKRLNALKAETERKRKKLSELQTREHLMTKDMNRQLSTSRGESEKAKSKRNIENQLDKAVLKQREAEHVKALYQKIKNALSSQALTFHSTLEEKEHRIAEADQELKRVKEMLVAAQMARDQAKQKLNENEESLIRERRERERALQELRLRAEEKRGAEAIERRATRMESRTGSTPVNADPNQAVQVSSQELELKIKDYEVIYSRIKDATGVSSIDEAVSRFESQGETSRHLQNLKLENENKIAQLKEERLTLEQNFNAFKYSDAESLAKADTEFLAAQKELEEHKSLTVEFQEKLERQNKLLLNVRSGVQHLADKLDFVEGKLPDQDSSDDLANQDVDLVAQISDILQRSGGRIDQLIESLGEDGLQGAKEKAGNDLTQWAINRVEEISPFSTIKSPGAHATRAPGDLSDDESSGDDDVQMLTREEIKKQAQNIIDSKTKKRVRKTQKTRRK